MAAAVTLYCRICKILLADGVWRVQMHHCTKFCQNWSFVAEILQFFEFSRWPSPPSWIFEITRLYGLKGSRGSSHISMTNFIKISQSVTKILIFFDCSRWRPSTILDLFGAYLDHPRWVHGGIYWLSQWLLTQGCTTVPPVMGIQFNIISIKF